MAFEDDHFNDFSLFLADQLNIDSIAERIVVENFILEERLGFERETDYANGLKILADFSEWTTQHKDYLLKYIYLKNKSEIPVTFKNINRTNFIADLEPAQYLIRVENLKALARIARKEDETRIYEKNLDSFLKNPGDDTARAFLTDFLDDCNQNRDVRPLFVGFWGEVKEFFENNDPEWPDKLRDCFGLGHLDPMGEPIPIVIFRYRLGEVAPIDGNSDLLAAIPTILDSEFSPFFCPTPKNEIKGQILDLSTDDPENYRISTEVLHRSIDYKPDHIYRFGYISRPPGTTGETARKIHFLYWGNQFKNFDKIKT